MATEKLQPGMLVRYAGEVTPLLLIQQLPRHTRIGRDSVERWQYVTAGYVDIEQHLFDVSLFEIILTPDTLEGE